MGILKGPSEGDVETTKKILNNFNYANFLPMRRSAGDNTIIL
jgi:hypothetical protein